MSAKEEEWDVHDDIAAEGGNWDVEDVVVDGHEEAADIEWFMLQTMDLLEEVVAKFHDTDEGAAWFAREPLFPLQVDCSVAGFIEKRNHDGWMLVVDATDEWDMEASCLLKELDAVREATHHLVEQRPDVLMAMAAWLSVMSQDRRFRDRCVEAMSRMRHLDSRVRDDRDWPTEAVLTYGFGQGGEDEPTKGA